MKILGPPHNKDSINHIGKEKETEKQGEREKENRSAHNSCFVDNMYKVLTMFIVA